MFGKREPSKFYYLEGFFVPESKQYNLNYKQYE
nr:MAG TPA: hypothetical protein [Caudoviricetes sp.]